MVIIGTEDGTTTGDAKLLIDFYKTFVKSEIRYEVGTWDEAEGIKIFYNTFISTKDALVNMIQDVAEKNGNMNVDVVTGALERSTQRILGPAYMKAGMGDGGGCHPRDNIALRWLADNLDLGYDLFDAITPLSDNSPSLYMDSVGPDILHCICNTFQNAFVS
jgi:UDPglucose 6-dehydrogenase